MKDIGSEKYFSIGFKLAERKYWTILFNILIYTGLGILALLTLVGILILPALFAGFIKSILKLARNEKVNIGECLSEGFKNGMWWKALLYFVIYVLGTTIGFILLILPGIYLTIAWSLGFFLLVDKGVSPVEALKKSRELVHRLGFWKILGVHIVLSIVVNLFSIIPAIGFVITLFLLPLTAMIYVAIYENAIGNPVTEEV